MTTIQIPDLSELTPNELHILFDKLTKYRDEVSSEWRSRFDFIKIHLEPSEAEEFKQYLSGFIGEKEFSLAWYGEPGTVGTTTIRLTKGLKQRAQTFIDQYPGRIIR